jgi:anti-sigma28 factor (negative regulator of flagellin synthesis)
MKVIEIERTVSTQNYSNVKMRAVLSENEDPIIASVELDKKLLEAITAIQNKDREMSERENKKYDNLHKLEILKRAIEKGKDVDLPF